MKLQPALPETRKPRIYYGYLIALVAFFIMVVSSGTGQTFGIFLKPLLAEFGWTRAMASGAQSIRGIESGLFTIAGGWLNDKIGPRRVVAICGFFLGLGFLLTSQISNIWQLYLFYGVLSSLGGGSLFVPLLSTVARWFVKRMGLMSAIIMSGTGIGAIIFAPVVTWLILVYGWRSSYVILGATSLVLIVLGAQLLRRGPAQEGQAADDAKEEEPSLTAGGFSLREAIRTRQFWMLCFINFFLIFSHTMVTVHIVIHATGLGISAIGAATILSVVGGATIAGRLIMGSIGDKIGYRLPLTISLILSSASLFWLVVARDLWMFYLFALASGFAYGGSAVHMSPIIAWLFGLKAHGVLLGATLSGGMLGGAIGGILTGYIFDITGSYQIAFLAGGTVTVAAFILAWILRPTSIKTGDNSS